MTAVGEHLTEHALDEGTRAARELCSELGAVMSVALKDRVHTSETLTTAPLPAKMAATAAEMALWTG